jgi:hypothetical protein
MKVRTKRVTAAAMSLGLVLAACGDDGDSADTTAAPADSSAGGETPSTDSAAGGEGVCPENLVIQTDWFPELEHGGTYQLIGPNGTISADDVNYSGPVQPQYAVGGLKTLTINTVKFDKPNSSILLDGEADMAYINLSDVIKDSAAVDMVAIAKTLHKDPQMVMWDPTQFDIQKPEDIAATGAPVLHFPGVSYIDYMIAKGYMTAEQSDPTYDGSDARFVSENGAIFQQGFATNEIGKYENEIKWKDGAPADVSFFTVGDLGFDNYPAAITMMKSRAAELDECLKILVPAMQQAWIDFFADPTPITDKMIEINEVHAGFWGLSELINTTGIELVESDGFAVNSADGTYCSFDDDRVQGLYDVLKPVYDEQGVEITDDVTSIYTNEYCAGAPGRP